MITNKFINKIDYFMLMMMSTSYTKQKWFCEIYESFTICKTPRTKLIKKNSN